MKISQPHAYYYADTTVRVQPAAIYDVVHEEVKDHPYDNINTQDYPVYNSNNPPIELDPAYTM